MLSCAHWVRKTALSTQSTLMIQVPLKARYYTILKALTTALEGLRAIICLMQTGILW